MDDMGDLLERLGRHFNEFERRYGRAGERFARRFERRFGREDEDEDDAIETDGDEVIERELHFGEQPELKLTANLMNVQIHPVAPGEKTRLVLRGRDLDAVEVETGTWDGGNGEAVAVDLRIAHGFRGFRGFGGLGGFGGFGAFGHRTALLYIPANTRVRARADAGKVSAEGMHDAELDLRTDAGRLQVERCDGRLRLRSSAGKMRVIGCSGM